MAAEHTLWAAADPVGPRAVGRGGADAEERAQEAPALDTMGRRAFWELRHARLRLAIAENDLAWAQELLLHGDIAPGVALTILEEVLEDAGGVRP